MLQLHVALPSGKRKRFSLEPSATVRDLKLLAQASFEVCDLKLVTPAGVVANLDDLVGLQGDDYLTAEIGRAHV